jgi:hypothetical protein
LIGCADPALIRHFGNHCLLLRSGFEIQNRIESIALTEDDSLQ